MRHSQRQSVHPFYIMSPPSIASPAADFRRDRERSKREVHLLILDKAVKRGAYRSSLKRTGYSAKNLSLRSCNSASLIG